MSAEVDLSPPREPIAQASARELRRRIRRALPAETFARQPGRVVWFAPLLATSFGGTAFLAAVAPPWPVALLVSVLIGGAYASTYLLAHEVMHGAVVASPRSRHLLGLIGLAPFLISPELWRVWHGRLHHGHANHDDLDPDVFGTEERFRSHRSTRVIAKLAPGRGSPLGGLALSYWLTLHGQLVLWVLSRTMPGFSGLRRGRAIAETVLLAGAWVVLGLALGTQAALFAIVLPMAVANFVAMSYIATNHLVRYRSTDDRPLLTTMSVRTWPLLDRLHFHFGHHVEHHLFPQMSGRFAPQVRKWLEANAGPAYVCLPHWRAVRAVLATPRTYADDRTLCDPDDPAARFDVEELAFRMASRPRSERASD